MALPSEPTTSGMNFAQLGWFGWRKFKFPSVQRHPNQTVKVTVHEGPENGQRKHHQTRRPPLRSMTDASDEVETLLAELRKVTGAENGPIFLRLKCWREGAGWQEGQFLEREQM